MNRKLLLGALLGAASCAAHAQAWTPLLANDQGTLYVDASSVNRTGDVVTARTKAEVGKSPDDRMHFIALTKVYCTAMETEMSQLDTYRPDGTHDSTLKPIPRRLSSPGTIERGMAERLCAMAK